MVLSISLYDEDVVCLGLRDGDGGNGTVTKQTTRAATVANVTMAQTPTSISSVMCLVIVQIVCRRFMLQLEM